MTGSRRSSTTNGQAIVTQNPRHSYPVFNDLRELLDRESGLIVMLIVP